MSGELPFVAWAWHPSLGDQSASGKIVFERSRLRFVADNFAVEIPLANLRISKTEDDEKAILFSDPDQEGCSITTVDDTVLSNRALLTHPHTRNQIRNLQSGEELKRRLKITFGVIAGFAVLVMIGSMATSFMVRALLARIPASFEQKVGADAMEEVKNEFSFVDDPKLMERVIHAVEPLTNALPPSGIQYKFYIAQEKLPNAFALPGGYVIITTGLLELAERPEEIAGVVSHEVAHVTQKHGFRKIIAAAGPYWIYKVFFSNGGGMLELLGAGSGMLIIQGFSQEYELEADDVGWNTLVSAHIDPRGLTEMLRKLELAERNLPKDELEIGALSDHPDTLKRIHRLDVKWQKLKDKSRFEEYNHP